MGSWQYRPAEPSSAATQASVFRSSVDKLSETAQRPRTRRGPRRHPLLVNHFLDHRGIVRDLLIARQRHRADFRLHGGIRRSAFLKIGAHVSETRFGILPLFDRRR